MSVTSLRYVRPQKPQKRFRLHSFITASWSGFHMEHFFIGGLSRLALPRFVLLCFRDDIARSRKSVPLQVLNSSCKQHAVMVYILLLFFFNFPA